MAHRHDILKGSLEKKRKRKLVRLWFFLFVVVFLVVVVITSFHNERFLVSQIDVLGNKSISTESITNDVNENLSGKYFFILPKNNFLIYPKREIIESLEKDFPRIESVGISLEGFQKISIKIRERNPAFMWCILDGFCRFMDSKGVVFSDDLGIDGDAFVKIEAGDMSVDLGEQAIPEETVFLLQSIIKVLPDILGASPLSGGSLLQVSILGGGDYQFTIREKGGENNWNLLINFEGDLSNLLDDLVSVVTSDVFIEDYNNNEALDYLDVRFGRKVFYKFK